MTMRVHHSSLIAMLALALAALLPGDAPPPPAASPEPALAEGAAIVVVEIRDLPGRWAEVEALPGLAGLLRASAGSLGWDEGAIPESFAAREILVVRGGAAPWRLALERAPSAEAAERVHAALDAAWDARLGEAPLVRGIVDLPRLRAMLRAWAQEEPLPLRAMLLEAIALKLAPFERAVFSRDIVEGELRFAARVHFANVSARPGPGSAPLLEPRPPAGAWPGGVGLSRIPALLRVLSAIEGLSLDVEVDAGGLLARGRARFDDATDRP